MNSAVCKIASLISDRLNAGLEAGSDVLFFAESALGLDSAEGVIHLLYDEESYDNGIIDLIFSPDRPLRIKIEPHIPRAGLSGGESDDLIRQVLRRVDAVTVYHPGTGLRADVTVTESLVKAFVGRLRLRKAVFCFNTADLLDPGKGEWYAGARLAARDLYGESSPPRDEFIARLAGSLLSDRTLAGEVSLEALTVILKLLGGSGAGDDFFSMISSRKRACGKALAAAAQFNEYSRRYSMEFMMSQRIKPPPEDSGALRREMDLLDLVSRTMFGISSPGFDGAPETEEPGFPGGGYGGEQG